MGLDSNKLKFFFLSINIEKLQNENEPNTYRKYLLK